MNSWINLKNGEYIAPGIKVIENAYNKCEELISIANNINLWSTALVGEGKQLLDKRNARSLTFQNNYNFPKEMFEVSQIIFQYGRQYANEQGTNFSEMENVQMLHYEKGSGFYDVHSDNGPNSFREFSAVLYLNDVDEGGGTSFPTFGVGIKPIAGNLVLFPSSYPYAHAAEIPVSNDKYALVTWFSPKKN